MAGRAFLDSNIVVYAFDTADPVRHAAAQRMLRDYIRTGNACVSTQVLGEVFVVLTRKVSPPLDPAEAAQVVHALGGFEVVEIGVTTVNLALHYVLGAGISYWDALIVAAARLSECDHLLSEDLNAGQVFDTVTVVNPFVEPG